jgi:hypothetical protein
MEPMRTSCNLKWQLMDNRVPRHLCRVHAVPLMYTHALGMQRAWDTVKPQSAPGESQEQGERGGGN